MEAADDRPGLRGEPAPRHSNQTVAALPLRLIAGDPDRYTSGDVLFPIHGLQEGTGGWAGAANRSTSSSRILARL